MYENLNSATNIGVNIIWEPPISLYTQKRRNHQAESVTNWQKDITFFFCGTGGRAE